MRYSNPEQLCFPPVAGQTLRADCEGGALSSDFGALLFRGIDRQIGLTERLTAAIHDQRHQSSIAHPLRDLLAQRMYQIASGRIGNSNGIFAPVSAGAHPGAPTARAWTQQRIIVPLPAPVGKRAGFVGHQEPWRMGQSSWRFLPPIMTDAGCKPDRLSLEASGHYHLIRAEADVIKL